ncbi:hypothetical protein KY329_03870 [Candidatus Woesearchaeota archaeon]|nr:hypothetical protein [Candidatus Woesearchaeota archaeon]
MHLSRSAVKELVEKDKLVEGYDNIDKQLTANGFDVRVCALVEIKDGGKLAIEKSNNVPPKLGKAYVLPGYEDRLDSYEIEEKIVTAGFVKLKKHQPYFLITAERFNFPEYLMGHNSHRSSIFRFTQSMICFGFDEAGYKGYLAFMLVPFLDSEVELGSRVASVSFVHLTGRANYEEQFECNQQGGKLF